MQTRTTYTTKEVAEKLGHNNWDYVYIYENVYSEKAYRENITLVLSDEPLDIDGQIKEDTE